MRAVHIIFLGGRYTHANYTSAHKAELRIRTAVHMKKRPGKASKAAKPPAAPAAAAPASAGILVRLWGILIRNSTITIVLILFGLIYNLYVLKLFLEQYNSIGSQQSQPVIADSASLHRCVPILQKRCEDQVKVWTSGRVGLRDHEVNRASVCLKCYDSHRQYFVDQGCEEHCSNMFKYSQIDMAQRCKESFAKRCNRKDGDWDSARRCLHCVKKNSLGDITASLLNEKNGCHWPDLRKLCVEIDKTADRHWLDLPKNANGAFVEAPLYFHGAGSLAHPNPSIAQDRPVYHHGCSSQLN